MDSASIVNAIFTPEVTGLLLQALSSVLVTVLVGLATFAIRFVKAKTSAEQYAFIQMAAMTAVQAAEQLGAAGYIADKKGVAIGMVNRALTEHGITGISAEAIDTAIESAVMEAFNQYKAEQAAITAAAPTTTAIADPAS